MINLLVTVFGGLLLIVGFYGMSFGFSTPPNFGLFFGGLCSSVFGIILMVFFASKVDLSRSKSSKPRKKIPKMAPKPVTGKAKMGPIESIGKNIKPPAKPAKKINPKKPRPAVSPKKSRPPVSPVKKTISEKLKEEEPMKKITPVTSRPIPKKVKKPSSEELAHKEVKTTSPPEFSKEEPKKAPLFK